MNLAFPKAMLAASTVRRPSVRPHAVAYAFSAYVRPSGGRCSAYATRRDAGTDIRARCLSLPSY